MALTTLLAVTASVLAAGLLVASRAPFDKGFAKQQGAHLTAAFDAALVTRDAVAATAAGSAASAGPFRTVSLRPTTASSGREIPEGVTLPPAALVGRPDAAGPVDRLDLTAGRWATATGEIVWAAGRAPFAVGDRVTFADAPGRPTLTVVGLARSVSGTAEAWTTPQQLAAMVADKAGGYQMLYRFTDAATEAQLTAHRTAIAGAVPADAMTGATSYLTVKHTAERTAATFVPFVVAFGVLGLCMSVLIIGVVVSGSVGAATRRIGILKAVGFTPAQVTRAYVGQALIPAGVGTVLGVVLGNLAAVPVLRDESEAFGTATMTIEPWVSVVVPVVALVAVAATAFVPALRAGRLHTVGALSVGRTPVTGRGRTARRLLGRLPLPRPVSLGLANPFTSPSRSATIVAAVALGALGVTFGVGLATSLADIQQGLNRRDAGAVIVQTRVGPPPGQGAPGPGAPGQGAAGPQTQAERDAAAEKVTAAVEAQPGTRRMFSTAEVELSVSGLAGATSVIAFDGDASWGSYEIISGRWFDGPGQVVVPTAFLRATGLRLGDAVTLSDAGRSVKARIVGESLDLSQDGRVVVTDADTLAGLGDAVEPRGFELHVDLDAGVGAKAYVDALNTVLQPLGAGAQVNVGEISSTVVAMDTLAGTLTVMLVVVAGMGVLNTVVLDTRERVHDLGVFKALGMSPRQTVAMVLTSVAGTGLLAGVIGVPAGVLLHHAVLPAMGRAAGTGIPPGYIAVFDPLTVLPLVLGGLVIAGCGALLPAGWAARIRTATALRTE
ncbi:ABC transporter permease [Dactylosporangium aurantiacum]|uniref:ABC transporter permease n=2 Tax=Dactylosporangium aurantiacum TaxID=35754 RepID=A0A9Q9MK82_9ACTN|nr:ABC transporter permease [Dactylosporangium aurantiacum]